MAKNETGGVGIWVLGVVGFFVLVIGVPLLLAAFQIITLPFLKFEKKATLNQGVISQTYDTQFCLSNYEWFKDTYNQIQQTDVKVQNDQDQLDNLMKVLPKDSSQWTFPQTQSYNNLTTDMTGAKNYKADLVGQYNSRASQLHRVACKELPLFVNP